MTCSVEQVENYFNRGGVLSPDLAIVAPFCNDIVESTRMQDSKENVFRTFPPWIAHKLTLAPFC